MFSERGFHGVKTRDLAAAAGVSEALLFRHFATKEELILGALGRYGFEEKIGQIEAILGGASPREGLLQIARFACAGIRIGKEKNSGSGTSYPGAHGTPDWLDKAKLMELGFDVSKAENIPEDRAYYAKLLPKEMLLVLELDGPAYREALEHARQHWQKQEALRAANVGKKEFEQRAKSAREQLDRDERDNTRLFVIDAGLDATALRTRYPDRTRYAIVRGHVQPQAGGKTGYVSGISIDEIHVPFTYRQVFEPMLRDVKRTQYGTSWPDKGYKVSVVYGKRFEPWITGVSLSSRAPLK